MIPQASVHPDVLRTNGEVREMAKPLHVWVTFNPADVRAGLLLAWIRQPGGGWWGDVVVIENRQPVRLAIGASALRQA